MLQLPNVGHMTTPIILFEKNLVKLWTEMVTIYITFISKYPLF